ncbi:MAG: hypothetical protein RLZZ385_2506 [Pseudomonadota bacterium]
MLMTMASVRSHSSLRCRTAPWLLLLLVVAPLSAQSQDPPEDDTALQISNRQQEVIEQYRSQLAELEGRLGPYDAALRETLESLADALIDAGDFDLAQGLLDRRLQLLRTLEGPENPAQLPVLEEMIANNIRRGEWQDVTRHFEFSAWIQEQNPANDLAQRLQARNDVAHWFLTAVSLDDPRNRIRNFTAAMEIHNRIVFEMEDAVGKDSAALIPWLYRHALNQYRIYGFLQAEDELGYDAFQEIQKGFLADEDYLRRALNTVKRIRDIVEQEDDLEAQAMALIYDADFQMLGDMGTAMHRYRQAAEKLLAAGFSQAAVDDFFATPVALPIEVYYTRLADMQAHARRGSLPDAAFGPLEADSVNLGQFTAWNESLPFLAQPATPAAAGNLELPYREVDVQFRINSRGQVSAPEVLRAEPDQVRIRRDAMEAVRKMQFRPAIVTGRGRRVDPVVMRYRYPEPQ